MSTRMPIAAAVKKVNAAGGFAIYGLPGVDKPMVSPLFDYGFNDSVFFEVQVAHDILMAKWKSNNHDKAYNANLPYPLTWLEWRDEVLNRYVACLLDAPDAGFRKYELGLGIGATFLTMRDGDQLPRIFPIEVSNVNTDASGVITRIELGTVANCQLDTEELTANEKVADYYFRTALTALSLINCKNVETRETGRVTLRRNGAQKRRGEASPVIKYRTIILPGGGSESDGNGGYRATALHRVRGHFKTFTDGRPLLGKHIGTYWWGWQVRGNAERGRVVSDYTLAGFGDGSA